MEESKKKEEQEQIQPIIRKRGILETIGIEIKDTQHFTNAIALGFAIIYWYIVLKEYQIPEKFETIVIMIISFYFGSRRKSDNNENGT